MLTSLKDAITQLIMERFDKKQADAAPTPAPEPAPTANGNALPSPSPTASSPKKRKASSEVESDDDLSDIADSPPPKKVKKKAPKPEAESDEMLAAKLQAEFNQPSRSTRGGGAKPKKPVKKEKGTKKKSKTKLSAADDSELESGDEKPEKERKQGGFNVSLILRHIQPVELLLIVHSQKLMNLSEPLSAMLGEPALSRPQTVKRIWAYVKERDLQDPNDKRQIRCDDSMRAVFKQDKVHMFTMNKLLAAHFYPVEE